MIPAPIITIPVRLHVTRGFPDASASTVEEASAAFFEVNRIYRPAGIAWRLEACLMTSLDEEKIAVLRPNADPNMAERVPNPKPLGEDPAMDPNALNVVLVANIRYVPDNGQTNLSLSCKPRRLMLVSERWGGDSIARCVARALATFFGLALTSTPTELLLTSRGAGTGLATPQRQALRESTSAWLASYLPAHRSAVDHQEEALAAPPQAPVVRAAPVLPNHPVAPKRLGSVAVDSAEIVLLEFSGTPFTCLEVEIQPPLGPRETVRHLLDTTERKDLVRLLSAASDFSRTFETEGTRPPPPDLLGALSPQRWQPRVYRFGSLECVGLGFDRFQNLALTLSLPSASELRDLLEKAPGGEMGSASLVRGRLQRIDPSDGALVMENDRRILPLSHCCDAHGPEGEWLGLDWLATGDELEISLWEEHALRIRATRARFGNRAVTHALLAADHELERLRALMAVGGRADALQSKGQDVMATALYESALEQIALHDIRTPYLLAKFSLSLMLLKLRLPDPGAAYAVWTSETLPFGPGVDALQAGAVGSRDNVLYGLMGAWLYALGPSNQVAAERMNGQMTSICRHLSTALPSLLPRALANWAFYLRVIFPAGTPEEAESAFLSACRSAGRSPRPSLDLPEPEAWAMAFAVDDRL